MVAHSSVANEAGVISTRQDIFLSMTEDTFVKAKI